MVSFYPGPSQLDPGMDQYLNDALRSGILSCNHRSERFMRLYEDTLLLFRHYFGIPVDYSLYFVSSATECWEILSRELPQKQHLHFYNGAFGHKGYEIHRTHLPEIKALSFSTEELPPITAYLESVLHCTPNETSNGTQLPASWLRNLREKNPEAYLLADATSLLGGSPLPMEQADVWFASVQKCLGLPSGLAVMICSKRFVEACMEQNESHYNTIRNLQHHFVSRQTTHTPNIMGIYLLYQVLQHRAPLNSVYQTLAERAQRWYELSEQHAHFRPLVSNPMHRSDTVLAFQGTPMLVDRFKKHAADQGYTIGNGYGPYKENTFRIANFPAHASSDVTNLQHLFYHFQ